MENNSVATRIREEQKDKFFFKLKKHKRCAFVAPPSLGKTTSAIRFALENTNRGEAIFVVGNATVKYIKSNFPETESDTFISYQSLLSLVKKEVDFKEYFGKKCFILFDEAHKVYAENWQNGVSALIDAYPKAYIAGTSICTYRTDGRNYIQDFFRGICQAELNLADCMELGIVPTPIYISVEKDMETSLRVFSDYLDTSPLSSKSRSELKTLAERNSKGLIENSKLHNILNKYIDYSFEARGTMRFIAFCPMIDYIENDSTWLIDEYKESFPNKSIKIYKYHSGIKGSAKSLDKLMEDFLDDKDDIDIKIMCSCNKLSESVHFDGKLTGILFLRHTQSAILFQQMFGRGLDANWEYPPIYIDVVDNINQNFNFLPTTGTSCKRNPVINVEIIEGLQRHCVLTDTSLEGSEVCDKMRTLLLATTSTIEGNQLVEFCLKFKNGITLGKKPRKLLIDLANEYNIHTNYARDCLRKLGIPTYNA